jgi:predicted nucleic acid-binding protein
MYTVDASVWVNSFDQQEAGHEISRQFLTLLGQQTIAVTVPGLALAEVAGAISRTRKAPAQAQAFAMAMSNLPNLTLISLDTTLSEHALRLAAQHGLRGADAVYAAVAIETGYPLVSLDNEHLTRLRGVIDVKTPTDALAALKRRS